MTQLYSYVIEVGAEKENQLEAVVSCLNYLFGRVDIAEIDSVEVKTGMGIEAVFYKSVVFELKLKETVGHKELMDRHGRIKMAEALW